MSRMPNIVTVTPNQTVLEAGALLRLHQVDSLPVVASDNPHHVVGKITRTRIMNHFIEEGTQVNEPQ